MKDWIKQFDEATQKELYAKAYSYMCYQKNFHGENHTIEDALKKIKESYSYEIEAKLDARTENVDESI